MSASEQFEEWWSGKSRMLPPQMKAMFRVAFLDAFRRGQKAEQAPA